MTSAQEPAPLHDDQAVLPAQPIQGSVGGLNQPGLFPVIGHGCLVADGLAQENHLGTYIAGGLEQDGIHVHMGGDAGGLGLDDLGPAHLQAFGRDPGVVGHVLGLVGRHPHIPVTEHPAQGRTDDAFAYIGAGAEDGEAGGWRIMVFTGSIQVHRFYFSIPVRAATPAS